MENKKFSWIDLAGSDAGVRQPRGSLKYDVFPPAVRPASWGISVKWTWTNVVPRPATTAPFARILLIATSATAGQVSHSPVLWSSHFALKRVSPRVWGFFFPSLGVIFHESFMAEEQMLTCRLWLLVQSAFCQIQTMFTPQEYHYWIERSHYGLI